jgi:hypothetical protein
MKASRGATRARLVPDPATAPHVAGIFEWRVYEKLSVPGIVRRLSITGVANPDRTADADVPVRARHEKPVRQTAT